MNKTAMHILFSPILAAVFLAISPSVLAVQQAPDDGSRSISHQIELEELRLPAANGNVAVQYNLGVTYHLGHGAMQDFKAAAAWYRMAAGRGHAIAQYNLGMMHYSGQDVTQNYHAAAAWYGMAAEPGLAMAQNNLGVMYTNGQGVEQDYQQAMLWYHKAADQGLAIAQSNIALDTGRRPG